MSEREFDVVVLGATGFTGQLVAEYLVGRYGVGEDLSWAIAGRNLKKLENTRKGLLPAEQREQLPLLVADSSDPASLEKLANSTRVLCTTVGPYAMYGSPVVAACVATGTDYCDLTGEVQWMAKMIAEHQDAAEASGARIVHTCGFDSIPSDLGTWFLQQTMLEHHGVAASRVKARVGRNRGTASGGTIASMLNMMEEVRRDPSVRKIMGNPYALYPAGVQPGQDRGDQAGARYDPDFDSWTSPFIMAAVNTRVVRRSNALLGFPWGEDFRYDESELRSSRFKATRNSAALGAGMFALALGPTRKLASRFLPAPGEGPSRRQREAGFYEIFFHGQHPTDRDCDMRVKVTGDMDPGYGSTSKMLGEAAVCLALDELEVGGGLWTPASAMAAQLLPRLTASAGLEFEVVDID
jgi:short subunit dehydrogenase-like uncharacterized protein